MVKATTEIEGVAMRECSKLTKKPFFRKSIAGHTLPLEPCRQLYPLKAKRLSSLIEAAFDRLLAQGIAEEESYPYAMRRGDCKCTDEMKKVKIAGYKCINIHRLTKDQIEDHIKRQPITCSIRSYESLHAHVGASTWDRRMKRLR